MTPQSSPDKLYQQLLFMLSDEIYIEILSYLLNINSKVKLRRDYQFLIEKRKKKKKKTCKSDGRYTNTCH